MTKLEKAQAQLENVGIYTKIENGTLYVDFDSVLLELASFEINFRAGLYEEECENELTN